MTQAPVREWLSAAEVVAATGCTPREVEFWSWSGRVAHWWARAGDPDTGTGFHRRYAPGVIDQLRRVKRLRLAGLELNAAFLAANQTEHPDSYATIGAGIYVIVRALREGDGSWLPAPEPLGPPEADADAP